MVGRIASRPTLSISYSYSYNHYRYLHSFPTRRSSDLSFIPAEQCDRNRHERKHRHNMPWTDRYRSAPINDRSEEHTSELQSHHDLVCRLLLEEKKHIK